MFATSTYVELGNAAAVCFAPSGEVRESMSPASTSVGTSGNVAPGGTGGSTRLGRGHSIQESKYSTGEVTHSRTVKGAKTRGRVAFRSRIVCLYWSLRTEMRAVMSY